MKVKVSYLVIFFIAILLIGISGCLTTDDDGESYFELFYEIQIASNTSGELLFPIPYDSSNIRNTESNNYSKLAGILSVKDGNGDLEIINTDKGFALKIGFTENIHITGGKRIKTLESIEYDDYYFDQLTLGNESGKNCYYIFSSTNNVTIENFICYFEYMGSLDSVRQEEWKLENHALEKGWNSLELR